MFFESPMFSEILKCCKAPTVATASSVSTDLAYFASFFFSQGIVMFVKYESTLDNIFMSDKATKHDSYCGK